MVCLVEFEINLIRKFISRLGYKVGDETYHKKVGEYQVYIEVLMEDYIIYYPPGVEPVWHLLNLIGNVPKEPLIREKFSHFRRKPTEWD